MTSMTKSSINPFPTSSSHLHDGQSDWNKEGYQLSLVNSSINLLQTGQSNFRPSQPERPALQVFTRRTKMVPHYLHQVQRVSHVE